MIQQFRTDDVDRLPFPGEYSLIWQFSIDTYKAKRSFSFQHLFQTALLLFFIMP